MNQNTCFIISKLDFPFFFFFLTEVTWRIAAIARRMLSISYFIATTFYSLMLVILKLYLPSAVKEALTIPNQRLLMDSYKMNWLSSFSVVVGKS